MWLLLDYQLMALLALELKWVDIADIIDLCPLKFLISYDCGVLAKFSYF
jgi:hypothetical protein